jgi:phosphatidylinositol alpha-1,6-mannosyltransferase
MDAIRKHSRDASLLIVGDGSYRARLESMAREAPVGSVVFAGAVPDEALPEYHAAADVFAMPCRNRWGGLEVEGFGIVFMEAAASGRAVVAGDSGGSAEAVADGTTGMVVNGRDQQAVAGAIAACLADPEMAVALGKAGRARAEEHFAWPEIASMVAGYLREAAR